jgi:hypothetical protein
MSNDKQLANVKLEDVLKKRQLDQALNAKEFAVLAGIAYCTARQWFRMPGFPVFHGVMFWQDFVQWRNSQHKSSIEVEAVAVAPVVAPARVNDKLSRILAEGR